MGGNCPLCNVKDEDIIWRDDGFFGLMCRTCHIPMIILSEHRNTITKEEMEKVDDILQRRYLGYRLRNIGMRDIKTHWHEHVIE